MKMSTGSPSPLNQTRVSEVTDQVIDRRAYRKHVSAEEERANAAAKLERERLAELNRIELEAKQLELDDKKDERRDRVKTKKRSERRQAISKLTSRVRTIAPQTGQLVLTAGPITAPMAVAWTSQTSFAINTLGWPGPAGVVFAAAWEASTAFCGWMYHEARKDGDHGLPYKVATWAFAGAAGVMNYWHNCPTVPNKDAFGFVTGGTHVSLDPTPKAVAYAVMSLSGIALWELYTSLKHKKYLRSKGVVAEARPKFGVVRWTRYPRVTYTAWSESVRSRRTLTVDEAWDRAVIKIDAKRRAKTAAKLAAKTAKDDRPSVKVTVARVTETKAVTLPKTKVRLFWTDETATALVARRPLAGLETTKFLGLEAPKTSGLDTSDLRDQLQRQVTERSRGDLPAETETKDHSKKTAGGDRSRDRKEDRSSKGAKTTVKSAKDKAKPTADDRVRGVERYLESVRTGKRLTKRELAEEFGFSPSWAYNCMREAGLQLVGGRETETTQKTETAEDHGETKTG